MRKLFLIYCLLPVGLAALVGIPLALWLNAAYQPAPIHAQLIGSAIGLSLPVFFWVIINILYQRFNG